MNRRDQTVENTYLRLTPRSQEPPMARYRNRRVVMPPQQKPPPAAPSVPAPANFDLFLMRAGVTLLTIVGAFAALSWVDGKLTPLPPLGFACTHTIHSTAAGRTHSRKCDVDKGWSVGRQQDGSVYFIPDDLRPLRRPWRYEAADGR
jgi:hypothetical protein